MTVRARVIPCLDVAEGRVVKGVNFVELRDAGDPRSQGVALALDLLTDVAEPLYNPAAEDRIDDTARRAAAALG